MTTTAPTIKYLELFFLVTRIQQELGYRQDTTIVWTPELQIEGVFDTKKMGKNSYSLKPMRQENAH